MTLLISHSLFKKQAKLLVKHWPRPPLKHTQALDYLAQLYGFKHHHHYHNTSLIQASVELTVPQIQAWLPYWVQRLAQISHLNQLQTKVLVLQIWGHILRYYPASHAPLYTCQFTFFGACLDFVAEPQIHYPFDDKPSIKNVIEALGLPHVEVATILANDQVVNLDYTLNHQDQLQVFGYPQAAPFYPLYSGTKPRFVLDVHLGGLARYLRLCNFDCWYSTTDQGDERLAEISAEENRVFLTRDLGALKRSIVRYGHWIRHTEVLAQWQEIINTYQLQQSIELGKRCVKCNAAIEPVQKALIAAQVPAKVLALHEQFTQCTQCRQVYWQGSHYERVQAALDSMLEAV